MTPKFHQLTIRHLERFGDFAVALGFAVPDELAESYRFLAGQYLTLRADIDGEEVRRPYSICTPPHSGRLGVGIKHVEGGRFSTHALATLAVGDSIDVMTPQGRFVHADQNDDAAGDILLLAAGSGVTPILSIAETALATGISVNNLWVLEVEKPIAPARTASCTSRHIVASSSSLA